MFKIILSALLVLGSFRAQAGDKVGNGGGLWTCSSYGRLLQGELVDLYEAREEFGLSLISSLESDPLRIVQERSDFIRWHLPEYSRSWNGLLMETLKKMRLVNSELIVVDDALYRIKPPQATCAAGWVYTQFANFTNLGSVLIRSDLWTSDKITPMDKAALIWHEVIYKWLREEKGDLDSVRARQIVGVLFSRLSREEVKAHLANILSQGPIQPPRPSPPPPPPPPEKTWICMIRNNRISTYYADYGFSRLEAQTKVEQQCRQDRDGFFCSSDIRCEEIVESQERKVCSNKNTHASQIFLGKGRSLLEAEFRAREQCQQNTDRFFCSSSVDCE